jgi:DNA-binding XRE family transcriptional regulator
VRVSELDSEELRERATTIQDHMAQKLGVQNLLARVRAAAH